MRCTAKCTLVLLRVNCDWFNFPAHKAGNSSTVHCLGWRGLSWEYSPWCTLKLQCQNLELFSSSEACPLLLSSLAIILGDFQDFLEEEFFMAGPGAGTVQAAVAFLTPGEKNYYLTIYRARNVKTKDNTMPSGGVSQQCLCIIIIMFPATFVLIVESKKNTREISGRLHRHHMHHRPSNLFLSFCNFCELLLSYLFYQHLCQYPCLFL